VNGLIVYYSQFGNTKRVAEEVAQAWQSAGSIRLLSADQLTVSGLSNVDLLAVGTPTHVANLPKELRPILEALPTRVLEGVAFAAFDTSYKSNWFVNMFTAAKPLNKKLRRLGGKQMVRPETFFVEGKEGPLYEGEIERAKAWAETVAAKYGRLSKHQ
jgi:flavodoxin